MLTVASLPAAAQSTRALASPAWAFWLQSVVNLSKVIELGAYGFAAYQFWAGRRDRLAADHAAAERARIDSNYQAWQVINSAQGKGGSGGRIEALSDLLRNEVSLAGIRLDDAWLEQVHLPRATLVRGSFQRANLSHANLAGANLEGADLTEAELVAADLSGANLRGAVLTGARLAGATLDGADVRDVVGWREVHSLGHASVIGVRNAPLGFMRFAVEAGAIDAPGRDHLSEDERSYSREFRAL